MNVTCENKILQDVRELIKDIILPKLASLENELMELRRVTWPVCQSLREESQLRDQPSKTRFLEGLDEVEAKDLLLEKAKVSLKELKYSTSHLISEEMDALIDAHHIRD
jgi:hypothetical protein